MVWLRIGAVSGALAVIFGAFGAHGIFPTPAALNEMPTPERRIVDRRIANFETGARYHMVHALALVGVGLAAASGGRTGRTLDLSGWSFLLGSAIFSGTLYGIGFGGPSWLGAITPIGGLGMILGWLLLAAAAGPVPKTTAYEV